MIPKSVTLSLEDNVYVSELTIEQHPDSIPALFTRGLAPTHHTNPHPHPIKAKRLLYIVLPQSRPTIARRTLRGATPRAHYISAASVQPPQTRRFDVWRCLQDDNPHVCAQYAVQTPRYIYVAAGHRRLLNSRIVWLRLSRASFFVWFFFVFEFKENILETEWFDQHKWVGQKRKKTMKKQLGCRMR